MQEWTVPEITPWQAPTGKARTKTSNLATNTLENGSLHQAERAFFCFLGNSPQSASGLVLSPARKTIMAATRVAMAPAIAYTMSATSMDAPNHKAKAAAKIPNVKPTNTNRTTIRIPVLNPKDT